jgi:hypothetical protein
MKGLSIMIWHWLLQDWPNFTLDAKKLEKAAGENFLATEYASFL